MNPQAAQGLALELLLRVWQRSDDGVLKRACGEESLLLQELAMERPLRTCRRWCSLVEQRRSRGFLHGFQAMCERAWTMSIASSAGDTTPRTRLGRSASV